MQPAWKKNTTQFVENHVQSVLARYSPRGIDRSNFIQPMEMISSLENAITIVMTKIQSEHEFKPCLTPPCLLCFSVLRTASK
jgi:hypothetical protein